MSELTRDRLLMAIISGRGPAYLRGVDLSSLDLSGAGWLAEADLSQANLSNTNLSRANLKDSKLTNANLHAANLSGATLEGADLAEAKLTAANLRMAILRRANLQAAGMVGARMAYAQLQGANLEGADLEGANLEGADLRGAKLNRANLSMASLRGANLEEASLLGTVLDQDSAVLRVQPPASGFAGLVNEVHLTDLVQLLCLSRASVVIQVKSGGNDGKIYVCSGKICHAQTARRSGEGAISEMLKWSRGRFETIPCLETPAATIDKSCEQLLFESVRQIDESIHKGESQLGLIEEIKGALPVPAFPTVELMELMGQEGKEVSVTDELKINDVFYSEDTGSILCSLLSRDGAFIAPLSYVKPRSDHPLSERILAYQNDNNDAKVAT